MVKILTLSKIVKLLIIIKHTYFGDRQVHHQKNVYARYDHACSYACTVYNIYRTIPIL